MKRIVKLIAGAVLAVCGGAWAGAVSGVSQEVEMTILPSGADVAKSVLVQCPLLGAESVSATIDGTLSFWWRVDCEPDPGKRFTWDRGVLTIDGKDIDKKDGITEWMNHSVTFDTAGEHEIVLTYISDGYLPVEDDVYAGCMWVDGFVWTPKEEFPALDASATKEMISQVLSGATDVKLSANIKTVA